jgi:molybdopterin synthase sulfur carrier subunit
MTITDPAPNPTDTSTSNIITTQPSPNPTNPPPTVSAATETDPKSSLSNNTGTGTSNGTFTVLLFASASSFASDTESLVLNAPSSLREVVAELEARWPRISEKVLRGCAWCVNLEYVDFDVQVGNGEGKGGEAEVVIEAGDEVAVVPPVSSG